MPCCQVFITEKFWTGACKALKNVLSAFHVESVVQVKGDNKGRILS